MFLRWDLLYTIYATNEKEVFLDDNFVLFYALNFLVSQFNALVMVI